MNATGTPHPRDDIDKFVVRIVTEPHIPMEVWLEGFEHLRVYILKEIFPQITLKALLSEEWFVTHEPLLLGLPLLFKEHGLYFLLENSKKNVLWGLSRSGEWVLGEVTWDEQRAKIKSAYLVPVQLSNLAEHPMLGLDGVATHIHEEIQSRLIERYRRYQDLDRAASGVEFFKNIAHIKLAQAKSV